MQQQVPGIPHNKLSHPFSMLQNEAAEAKAHVRSLCQTAATATWRNVVSNI